MKLRNISWNMKRVEKYSLIVIPFYVVGYKRARKICKYYEIDLSKMYSSAL